MDGGGTPATADDSTTDAASDSDPDPSDLSEKQREVLAVVAAEPTATQEETGERVGVSRATVNGSRVSSGASVSRSSTASSTNRRPPA